jgi:hypothetical protein
VRRQVALVFLIALVAHLAYAFAIRGPSDFDAWFHARYAQGLASGEIPWHGTSFSWMTSSAWADFPSDWALGWHWLVAPFAALGGIAGLVLAQALCAAGLTAAFHAVLLRAEVRAAWTWTALLLVGCAGWLHRTHQGRPTPAVVAALLLLLAAAIQRRPVAAGVAALAATLLYCVPTMPVVVGACGVLGALVQERRVPWRTGFAVLGGVALGIALHPGTWSFRAGDAFPASFHVWRLVAGSIDFASGGGAFVADLGGGGRAEMQIALPAELGAPSWGVLLTELRVPLLATLAALVAACVRRRDAWTVGCAAAAVFACAMTLRSGRFFEYWHPFATLAAGVAVGRVADSARARWTVAGAALLLVAIEVPRHREAFARHASPDAVAPAVRAIEEHAAPGDVIFHGSWDDFAPAWYHSRKVRWLTGMDPWFFVAHDPALVAWHAAAVQGQLPDAELRRTVVERFGAHWVLLWPRPGREDRYDALVRQLEAAPWAERVDFIDSTAAASVYRVR